ncbi:hypothetical protein MMPV_004098 [Pyropia vietnamensis]
MAPLFAVTRTLRSALLVSSALPSRLFEIRASSRPSHARAGLPAQVSATTTVVFTAAATTAAYTPWMALPRGIWQDLTAAEGFAVGVPFTVVTAVFAGGLLAAAATTATASGSAAMNRFRYPNVRARGRPGAAREAANHVYRTPMAAVHMLARGDGDGLRALAMSG